MSESTKERYKQSGNSVNWLMIAAAVIAMVAIFLPEVATQYIEDQKEPPMTSFYEGTQTGEQSTATTKGTISQEKYIEAFVWVARGKLEDLGINQSLKVSGVDDEKIMISGTVTNNQQGRYKMFKSWFAGNDSFPEMIDQVEVIELWGALPGIKSVWLGDPALAYFDDGSTGRIGEEVGDGWEIVKIDQTAILLHKDGTLISMDY